MTLLAERKFDDSWKTRFTAEKNVGVYSPFAIKHVSLFSIPFCYRGMDKLVAAILAAANRKTSVFCSSVGILGMADPTP